MRHDLRDVCMQIRRDTVRSIYRAGSGHPGSSLSAVEIMATLYFTDIFTCFPDRPHAPERDRFVLSKGHAAPAFYSTLAHKGYFPLEWLDTLRTVGSPLQGHPNLQKLPCLDCAVGSLGQGLSIANGMALGLKRKGQTQQVFCLIGGRRAAGGTGLGSGGLCRSAPFGQCLSHRRLQRSAARRFHGHHQGYGTDGCQVGQLRLARRPRRRHDTDALYDAYGDAKPVRINRRSSWPRRSRARAFLIWKTRPNGTVLRPMKPSTSRL